MTLSAAEYKERIISIHGNSIKVLGSYVNQCTPILHKHVCGYKWKTMPKSLLNGSSCPECHRNQTRKTDQQYRADLAAIHKAIVPLEPYRLSSTKIKHKCLSCERIWKTTPTQLLQGYGCAVCAGNIQRTHKQYVAEVRAIDESITVVGKYVNRATAIEHKCAAGHSWWPTPNSVLQGHGCQQCAILNKNGYKRRTVKVKGKAFVVQGYEARGIRTVIKRFGVEATDIEAGSGADIPIICYKHKGKKHNYYPDLYVPKLNLIVEVKSTWSFAHDNDRLERNRAKAKATIKAGYEYLMLVYSNDKLARSFADRAWLNKSAVKLRQRIGVQ